jgi:hypothetical protein
MIYFIRRALSESPALLLFNVGAWSILGLIASNIFAVAILTACEPERQWEVPFFATMREPSPLERWGHLAFSGPGLMAQLAVIACGTIVVLFSVGLGVYRWRSTIWNEFQRGVYGPTRDLLRP